MKSGSGKLDFGGDDDEPEDSDSTKSQPTSDGPDQQPSTDTDSADSTSTSTTPAKEKYPYFVRRNNVGDERDTRLEIHTRDEIAKQEAAFRTKLAAALDTDDVAKTDAREFALQFAFKHPEAVAELMQEEGYGLTD